MSNSSKLYLIDDSDLYLIYDKTNTLNISSFNIISTIENPDEEDFIKPIFSVFGVCIPKESKNYTKIKKLFNNYNKSHDNK